ncbi:MAG: stage II sporulation protein M, partial [Arenimonas sp.]
PLVLEPLAQLVRRGHTVLYRAPNPRLARVLHFFGAQYPRLVRRHARFLAVSAALLFVPMIAMIVLVQVYPELALSVMSYDQLAQMESMYDPADPRHALGRDGGTNLEMFGHYILNNISIAFRAFAGGLVACVGAIFVLVPNGIIIGTVAGHLTQVGHGGPFWRFVVGHAAPELGAIALAGAAGLRVGWALLAPGRLSRPRALVEAGRDGGRLVLGVFALLVLAAFIEAYWSSIGWMPSWIKFSFGGLGWLLLGYWLLRGGRGQADAP